MLFRSKDEEYLSSLSGQNRIFSYERDLNKSVFSNPALIAVGRQDSVVGYEDAFSLSSKYPRATITVIDAAGHGLFIEQNSVFVQLVQNWIERIVMNLEKG